MKNSFKFLGIIALVAVIGLSTGCPQDGGVGGIDLDDSSGITTIKAPLKQMPPSITIADFNYINYNGTIKIDTEVNGAAVTVSGSDVTFTLGAPRFDILDPLYDYQTTNEMILYMPGATVTDGTVKLYTLPTLYSNISAPKRYTLKILADNYTDSASLVYAEKEVTFKGKGIAPSSTIYDFGDGVTLKKGWNYISYSQSGAGPTGTTSVSVDSSLPGAFDWVVD
jgi:hypothetical protein